MADPNKDRDLREQFIRQAMGQEPRSYPQGRIAPDDDGQVVIALAADRKRRRVIVRFPHPVEWIGLDEDGAADLIRHLVAKLRLVATRPFTLDL